MNALSSLISPRTQRILDALETSERETVIQALALEIFLGVDTSSRLTPLQYTTLAMVRAMMEREMQKMIS